MPTPRRRPLDLRQLRREITPRQALEALGWRPVWIRGELSRGPCPVHGSSGTGSRILSLTKEVAFCHRCRWSGDAVGIYAKVKGLPTLEAAYELCERFGITPPVISL